MRRPTPYLVATLLAVAVAGFAAWSLRWTSDDAFISFRYARNLDRGLGLVFNTGERVEGYSNFLWTLWIALGLRLGAGPEAWADAWSIACHVGSILLLAACGWALQRRRGGAVPLVPVAALGGALNRDWNVFATGGLETSAFSFALLAGYALVQGARSATRLLAAGTAFAAVSLLRPDGVLPAAVAGVYVLWTARPRWRSALLYALPLVSILAPLLAWRLSYYGDLLPNTYYAKSANLAWYGQGLRYLQLYLEKYWALAFGPILYGVGVAVRRARGDAWSAIDPDGALALCLALAASYGFYVVRVGGDFMYARLWIPLVPLLLLLLEQGASLCLPRRVLGAALPLALIAGSFLSPEPVTSDDRYGIVDERAYYSPARLAEIDHHAGVLRRYFDGLPVRVAFYGSEARLVYEAEIPVAIESHTGLTDRLVARRPLLRRGRVGHEKFAPLRYLIERRKVHFVFSGEPQQRLARLIPKVIVTFEPGVYGQLLHWDPALMAELVRRGAKVQDFPERLDAYLRDVENVPAERVRQDYERFRRFYFAHVSDPERESRFLARIRSSPAVPGR